MKRINLIFSILIALCIGCGDDDDNRIDQIAENLSTSLSEYQNAPANSWIEITELEFDLLAMELSGVTTNGATQGDFNNGTSSDLGGATLVNTNPNRKIPQGNYLFAFRYLSDANGFDYSDTHVKISYTNPDQEVSSIGRLPTHNGNGSTRFHFVYKGDLVMQEDAFLGMFAESLVWVDSNATTCFYDFGFTSSPSTTSNRSGCYQGLSTSSKQW